MKTFYKNLLYTASGILVCLFLALNASAQRPSTSSGGGGGSSKPSGGGSSTSSARPSGGGGASYARPSGGGNVSRPPSGSSVQRGGSPGHPSYVTRQGTAARGTVYVPHQGFVRGNNGYPARIGIAPVRPVATGYRTAPQIGYGRGSYWGTHNYLHFYHGYYNSYYLPKIGFRCNVLPYGYYPFFWGDYQYFYSDGLYYQYDNDEYTVVEPPIGAEITTLPDKAQSIVINGVQYYELNGVYYMPVTKDDGSIVYEVVGKDGELNTTDQTTVQDQQPQGPQMGDIVTQLPPDCKKIKVNGSKLWVSPDGVYYQEQVDANGNKTYKIVGLPSDEPDQQNQQ
jgi:hypothetical protein